jgi:hypothetical protein
MKPQRLSRFDAPPPPDGGVFSSPVTPFIANEVESMRTPRGVDAPLIR